MKPGCRVGRLHPCLFCTMRLMLRNATYCISGWDERSVTEWREQIYSETAMELCPLLHPPRGGASFLPRESRNGESSGMASAILMRTLTADRTTAALAWDSRGVTRSHTLQTTNTNTHKHDVTTQPIQCTLHLCASLSSEGVYTAMESRMKTCPHSVHSLRAVRSLLIVGVSRSERVVALWDVSPISAKAATALATT